MISLARNAQALAVLGSCVDEPPDSELLPLLALSVLATQPVFDGGAVADLALRVARAFDVGANTRAAGGLLTACAASLERCGALESAADVREQVAIRHWELRRRTDNSEQRPGLGTL